MARNEEKQHGRLNRLILSREKEEYEKNNPQRPKLDSLQTKEEIQKWLPSIKKDLLFYLNKSQVTCYSDQQIEECRMKVVKLEKEFKAFVRKIRQLTPGTLEDVPWTSRAYKRKSCETIETGSNKQFTKIPCPLLEKEEPMVKSNPPIVDLPSMNEPLSFNFDSKKDEKLESSNINTVTKSFPKNTRIANLSEFTSKLEKSEVKDSKLKEINAPTVNIVNYDYSSDSDSD